MSELAGAEAASFAAVPAGGGGTSLSFTYSYDKLYRLTGVSGSSSASYTYDPAGNRSTKDATSYSYDRADRIGSAGGTTYSVNNNGNLVAKGTDTFTYDQANRLKTASVGGTSSSYVYDGDGKRTSKTVGGATTSYVYDINASLPVLLDDGIRKYVWGIGLAYAVDSSGNPIVYHTDGLGSIRALTDSSGTVVQTYLAEERIASLFYADGFTKHQTSVRACVHCHASPGWIWGLAILSSSSRPKSSPNNRGLDPSFRWDDTKSWG